MGVETLSKSQVNLLKRAFGAFELEGKNKIPTNELGTILEMMGIQQSQLTVNSLIDEFDPWRLKFGPPEYLGQCAYRHAPIECKEDLIDSPLQTTSSNHDTGEIDYDSFAEIAARYLAEEENPEQMQQELREAFRLYDKEGNGYITTEVMREILAELDNSIPDEELDQIIDEIDADGSGTVDFEEFMQVMTGSDE